MEKGNHIKYIQVLIGASNLLVTDRELRVSYQTNRSIKTWATYFLLKSMTTSGQIKNWIRQQPMILDYCKMTVGTFRARLTELKKLQLITVTNDRTIILTSFEKAAAVIGIKYSGITKIEYNENAPGKQIFQYYLVMDEIKNNQELQLETINYKINKNLELKSVLQSVMIQRGADAKRLDDKRYFQKHLLDAQMHFFKAGSDIWTVISQFRADINRSCNGIKRKYKLKSAQSVSYLKGRLVAFGIATIEKYCVESKVRTRLYVPDGDGKKREGVKYCRRTKQTLMVLCDSIISKIKIEKMKT